MERTLGSRRIALGLIFTIMLLDVIGITILGPVSVYIVREYSDSAMMVILLNVIYAAAQFLAAPPLGKLSDRFGRRPVLLLCLLGAAAGYLMFGLGTALWMLFLGRLIAGITGGSLATASTYIVDVSRREELAKNLSLIGLAWGVGLVIGPALGGLVGQIDLRAPAYIAAALCLLNMLVGIFLLPESLPKERRRAEPIRAGDFNAFRSIGVIGRIPGLALLLVVLVLFNFGVNGIYSTESLFLIQRFALLPWQVGLLQMLVGIAVALIQASVPFMVKRIGEQALGAASLAAQSVTALAISLNHLVTAAYPLVILRSAAGGYIYSVMATMTAKRVQPHEQGELMGVSTALTSLTAIFGPLLAGLLYDHVGTGSGYWIAAVLMALGAGLLALKRDEPAVARPFPGD